MQYLRTHNIKKVSTISFSILLFMLLLISYYSTSTSVQALAYSEDNSIDNQKAKLQYSPDRVIIQFKSDTFLETSQGSSVNNDSTSLDKILNEHQVQSVFPLFPSAKYSKRLNVTSLSQFLVLHLKPGSNVMEIIKELLKDPSIAWAEPDYLAYPINTIPNDTHFSSQWGLDKIQAPSAWDKVTGSQSVAIAVVDTGIDMNHPDFFSKIWINPGEIANNGIDDDNNGYIDDVNGWDFVNADNNPTDDNGHGTQIAGIAAAASNNGTGITGVCWNCTIMAVKVMQSNGVANYSDIASGVLYAAQKGARVINLSLGGYSNSSALQAAIKVASETYGATIVGGVGNDNLNSEFYPAAYSEVLAIAGTTISDEKTAQSNYGEWVDLSAPAEAITTTFMGGDYGSVQGTSFAASFTSGLTGLLISQHPDWSQTQVRSQLIHTADNIDSLNPEHEGMLGEGRINANNAVNTSAQPLLTLIKYSVNDTSDGRPEPGSTVELKVTLFNDWAIANNVQAALSTSDQYVNIVKDLAPYNNIRTYQSKENITPFQFDVAPTAPYAHDMVFNLTVTADGGYTTNIPITITTSPGIEYVHGLINTQTWTNDRIYIIDNDAGIVKDNILTIEPGTKVSFDGPYSLSVAGTLIADGTKEMPIIFTSNLNNPTPGDWRQIKFLDSSIDATFDNSGNYTSGSIIRNTVIEYGYGVDIENAAPFISSNVINNISGIAIGGNASPGLKVSKNTISNIAGQSTGISIGGDGFSIFQNSITDLFSGIKTTGPGTVTHNVVNNIEEIGIEARGTLTITANRVVDCGVGIYVSNGIVSENLIAHNIGYGIQIDVGSASYTSIAPTVISNTILYNGASAIYIQGQEFTPVLNNNNIIADSGQYAIEYALNTSEQIDATQNWWGTTEEIEIQTKIYDVNDQFGLGFIDYSNFLSSPVETAPAYVTDVSISPDSTLGIQTATFDVHFSRSMNESTNPNMYFYPANRGLWQVLNTSNSPLSSNEISELEFDQNGNLWIATHGGGVNVLKTDGTWLTYNSSNSGLKANYIWTVTIDDYDNHWFSTYEGGVYVLKSDGSWQKYTQSNSGLAQDYVNDIYIDKSGNTWFGTFSAGVSVLRANGTWQTYNVSNSGLAFNGVSRIEIDKEGNIWFGSTDDGTPSVSVYKVDGTWITYNTSNSGIGADRVDDISFDRFGNVWFAVSGYGLYGNSYGDYYGLSLLKLNGEWEHFPFTDHIMSIAFDDEDFLWAATRNGSGNYANIYRFTPDFSWENYYQEDGTSGFSYVVIDDRNNRWFGTLHDGFRVNYQGYDYAIDGNGKWMNNQTWQTQYDITSLIDRDTYKINISGVKGNDGLKIYPEASYTFTVDYAGAISDYTAPPEPSVIACAGETKDTITAKWNSFDPESSITLYRYAIGTTPIGTDVLNWTTTTETFFERTGLNLSTDQVYYVSVKARNVGGLWSEPGTPDGLLAGSGTCETNIYRISLPLIKRN